MAKRARVLRDDARPAPSLPLCSLTARLPWLRAVCAVAEGADVPLSHALPDASCVAAVLGDALRRVAVLGGREGMPRSLGSVYGGAVTRFLGGSLRGVESRVIDTPGVVSSNNGMAVSHDGSTLLVSDCFGGSHAIHKFDVMTGSLRRVVGGGVGRLQFQSPWQLWIAPDDFVFVADYNNNRVQVLTPTLELHGFVGVGELSGPLGVCANADVVVVSEYFAHCISVFSRSDGTLLRRFGSAGSGDGQLMSPRGLCFMSSDHYVAVADWGNDRVSVFTIDGEFIRHVGVGGLNRPQGVACSAFDEIVVADVGHRRVAVFSDVGDLVMSFGEGDFSGVAIHGCTLFAQDHGKCQCVLWS
jgi:sugar lactone lactonase YvrE